MDQIGFESCLDPSFRWEGGNNDRMVKGAF